MNKPETKINQKVHTGLSNMTLNQDKTYKLFLLLHLSYIHVAILHADTSVKMPILFNAVEEWDHDNFITSIIFSYPCSQL